MRALAARPLRLSVATAGRTWTCNRTHFRLRDILLQVHRMPTAFTINCCIWSRDYQSISLAHAPCRSGSDRCPHGHDQIGLPPCFPSGYRLASDRQATTLIKRTRKQIIIDCWADRCLGGEALEGLGSDAPVRSRLGLPLQLRLDGPEDAIF